jgi:hypothetical protein
VFNVGDAGFYGSGVSSPQASSHRDGAIVGIATTPNGKGYWLAGKDGSILPFGNASTQKPSQAESRGTSVASIS